MQTTNNSDIPHMEYVNECPDCGGDVNQGKCTCPPQECGYCGQDAGDDWETVDDEHQEAICQACKKAGAHLKS